MHVILRRDNEVLLSLRAIGQPGGGRWQLPGGHLEPGETALAGAVREVQEEVGVAVDPLTARLEHVCHVFTTGGAGRIVLLFAAGSWHGTPHNREPEICAGLGFFPADRLPRPMTPHLAHALRQQQRGETFSSWRPRP